MQEFRGPDIEVVRFNKGTNLTLEERRKLNRNFALGKTLPPSKDVNSLNYSVPDICGTFLAEWAKQTLDIDEAERIRHAIRKTNLYSPKEWEGVAPDHVGGVYRPLTNEVGAVLDQSLMNSESGLMHRLTHEYVHALCKRTIKVEKDSVGEIRESLIYGFMNEKNTNFQLFNESLTELMALEFEHDFSKDPRKYDSNPSNTTDFGMSEGNKFGNYIYGAIMVDMMVEKAAENLQIPVRNLRHDLYRGMINSDFSVLRKLRKGLGDNSLRVLSGLKTDILSDGSYAVIAQFAEDLGIDREEFESRARDFKIGKAIVLDMDIGAIMGLEESA
jgi:hypothetical protein